MELGDAIRDAGAQVSVPLSGAQVARLVQYVELVFKWNRIANLTGVRDVAEFIARHLSDCLSILPHVPAGVLADIGSGAGLPGLVLACVAPERRVFLVEPRAKRARFLEHARIALQLPQVEVVNARVEDWRPDVVVDAFVCRALGSVAEFVAVTAGLQRPGCRLLAMKGQVPAAELAGIHPRAYACRVHALQVPGWRDRHLVELVRRAEC